MIYVVNGFPSSGKTTFELNMINELFGHGCMISSVDCIKEILVSCGWDGEKTDRSRRALSELKQLLQDFNGYPYVETCNRVIAARKRFQEEGLSDEEYVIFIDCREPDTILKFCNFFKCKSILIRRQNDYIHKYGNKSDDNILNYDYDIVIHNDGYPKEMVKQFYSKK